MKQNLKPEPRNPCMAQQVRRLAGHAMFGAIVRTGVHTAMQLADLQRRKQFVADLSDMKREPATKPYSATSGAK